MTLDHFRQLAETWGGDIDRWPGSEQTAARDFAESNAEAARILDDHRQFDRLLASAPEVSEDRAGRAVFAVMQQVARDEYRVPWYRRLLRPAGLLPAASLACSAMFGLWLAASLPYASPEVSAVAMVFDSATPISWVLQ